MVIVDDVRQLSPVHRLFEDPHLDGGGELLQVLHVASNDFRNS